VIVTGASPKELIQRFRNSPNPRIPVTVDMIATGTDIKPLEIVMFMRSVKSRSFFEQMKGGVRVISDTDFQSVTPDAKTKTHFVIVGAVGICERDKTDSRLAGAKAKHTAGNIDGTHSYRRTRAGVTFFVSW
jgi:type I restriction enzyme R subunit